ncbi:sigma factor-like helix-turn-helix DNA-binding protein [Streptomyces sp. NPDC045470]|uniref:sigma factor-like helix-turn-helix DNA-binding protein n=1 Tax=Streptomyces sp. NPDC045470 TaxID=3155469 RepID=UPI0033D61B8D
MTSEEVAERLDTLSDSDRSVAALVYLDGHSLREVAEMHGVMRQRIWQQVRKVKRAVGISSDEEWQEFLQEHGRLLAPCLAPGWRADGAPCPRVAGADVCGPCDEVAKTNQATFDALRPAALDGSEVRPSS